MNAPTLSPPPGRAIALLAKDHAGMRVDYQGLLKQSRDSLTREEPALAEMLRQFESHITQLGRRWYARSEEHTSELQSLMRTSYAVFCLKKKKEKKRQDTST